MSDTSARRTEPPIVVSIISTKGGVGKTTTAANLGGFLADAGMRVLLLDLDIQPTLSSYFPLERRAPGGIYEMLAFNEQDRGQLISTTAIGGLDLLLSNDAHGQLNTLLLHAADGRLRLRNLLGMFRAHYDLLLIDTQGARSVLLEMAVLASDVSLSPVTPEILAARELRRGTLSLMEEIAPYRRLGIEPPPLRLLINRVHTVSVNARQVQQALRSMFQPAADVRVLDTTIPAIEAYPAAALRRLPVHRVEYRQPRGRLAPAALESQRALAIELFPQWRDRLDLVTGRATHADPH
ncbi:AAA family ATPase [Xanthomonas citri pv. citri]|uniref:AAA family ATPase n=3 Tax=Xanthomonas citri TaxID=346 RepID=A0A0U5FDW2_XANCI|nr:MULTISPECIES: ParA family protein [Xanthomonas]AGH77691.1 chromosome partitioning-like protein [Xanthomonas axonopodis Xac29-1]AJD68793.1 ATPase involved in chromosome partitioning [Xanthomonas citri subsp. citri A306]AJY82319.1 ATPases involved in chromosome partitioning [Xanthomonas citri pv. citri]AJY86742.1 ATPases involved in chromosome partitioning [Xanthomonas citri subsp. citri UI6]AJY91173.1 ATPases involved in chromosome partitioning [Xanthomonas citri pv. citri]